MQASTSARLILCLKALLLVGAAVYVFAYSNLLLKSFHYPLVYEKDFLSGYLLAQAMQAGINPYLPLPLLAQQFLGPDIGYNLNHPTPHPITVGWLAMPFAALGYQRGAIAWTVVSLACLFYSLTLLFRILAIPLTARLYALNVFWCVWTPVLTDLYFGQLNFYLLALLMTAWWCLRQSKDWQGGVCLGFAVALKFAGWPLLLWLLWQKRGRPSIAAGLVFVSTQLIAAAIYGWPLVLHYFTQVAPQLKAIYGVFETNYAVWTWGGRLFAQYGNQYQLQPLWFNPRLAQVVSAIAFILVLGLALWSAQRANQFDRGFALLLGIGTILNPIAWLHYFVMLIPAFFFLVKDLQQRHWPYPETALCAACFGLLQIRAVGYYPFVNWFISGQTADGKALVPALASLLVLLPVALLFTILFLLMRNRRQPSCSANSAEQPAPLHLLIS